MMLIHFFFTETKWISPQLKNKTKWFGCYKHTKLQFEKRYTWPVPIFLFILMIFSLLVIPTCAIHQKKYPSYKTVIFISSLSSCGKQSQKFSSSCYLPFIKRAIQALLFISQITPVFGRSILSIILNEFLSGAVEPFFMWSMQTTSIPHVRYIHYLFLFCLIVALIKWYAAASARLILTTASVIFIYIFLTQASLEVETTHLKSCQTFLKLAFCIYQFKLICVLSPTFKVMLFMSALAFRGMSPVDDHQLQFILFLMTMGTKMLDLNSLLLSSVYITVIKGGQIILETVDSCFEVIPLNDTFTPNMNASSNSTTSAYVNPFYALLVDSGLLHYLILIFVSLVVMICITTMNIPNFTSIIPMTKTSRSLFFQTCSTARTSHFDLKKIIIPMSNHARFKSIVNKLYPHGWRILFEQRDKKIQLIDSPTNQGYNEDVKEALELFYDTGKIWYDTTESFKDNCTINSLTVQAIERSSFTSTLVEERPTSLIFYKEKIPDKISLLIKQLDFVTFLEDPTTQVTELKTTISGEIVHMILKNVVDPLTTRQLAEIMILYASRHPHNKLLIDLQECCEHSDVLKALPLIKPKISFHAMIVTRTPQLYQKYHLQQPDDIDYSSLVLDNSINDIDVLKRFIKNNEIVLLDSDQIAKKTNIEHLISAIFDLNVSITYPSNLTKTYDRFFSRNINWYRTMIHELLATNGRSRIYSHPSISSRGYSKMDELITKYQAPVKGNILDCTAGSGGMSQRMCQEGLVSVVYANTFIEANHRKRVIAINTTGATKIHLLDAGSGDIQSDVFLNSLSPLPKMDLIVMDCGEYKPTYPEYCAWYLAKLLALNSIISKAAKGGSSLIFKFYCYDEAIHEALMSILSKYNSTLSATVTASRNPNGEIYIIARGFGDNLRKFNNLTDPLKGLISNVHAKNLLLVDESYQFILPTYTAQPNLDFISKDFIGLISDDLQPMNFDQVFADLKSLYGFTTNTDQTYGRFKCLGQTTKPLDVEIGNFATRPFFSFFFDHTPLLDVYTKVRDWTVTKVDGIHVFASMICKYDNVQDLSNFPKALMEEVVDFFILKVIGDKKFVPKTFQATVDSILASKTRKSKPGQRLKYMGDTVQDVITHKSFKPRIEWIISQIEAGMYPVDAVYATMGKLERKKFLRSKDLKGRTHTRRPDSRIIFFSDCTFRFIEEMYFGELFDRVVDPAFNKFAVGHDRYTDYGDIMFKKYQNMDFAIERDIAGWDTRFHVEMRNLEYRFVKAAFGLEHQHIVKNLYRIYTHALITIPKPTNNALKHLAFDVAGRLILNADLTASQRACITQLCMSTGTRLSGERGTYSLNTLSNSILNVAQCTAYARKSTLARPPSGYPQTTSPVHSSILHAASIPQEIITVDSVYSLIDGVISGDDSVMMYKQVFRGIEDYTTFWDDVSFTRKDKGATESDIVHHNLQKVSFCSSYFAPINVTFTKPDETTYVIKKYLPYRPYSEIFGKYQYSLSGHMTNAHEQACYDKGAALSALINYVGMRRSRWFFLNILSSIPDQLFPMSELEWYGFRPNLDGQTLGQLNLLKILRNSVFPLVEDEIRSWKHVGYISMTHELSCEYVHEDSKVLKRSLAIVRLSVRRLYDSLKVPFQFTYIDIGSDCNVSVADLIDLRFSDHMPFLDYNTGWLDRSDTSPDHTRSTADETNWNKIDLSILESIENVNEPRPVNSVISLLSKEKNLNYTSCFVMAQDPKTLMVYYDSWPTEMDLINRKGRYLIFSSESKGFTDEHTKKIEVELDYRNITNDLVIRNSTKPYFIYHYF